MPDFFCHKMKCSGPAMASTCISRQVFGVRIRVGSITTNRVPIECMFCEQGEKLLRENGIRKPRKKINLTAYEFGVCVGCGKKKNIHRRGLCKMCLRREEKEKKVTGRT